MPKRFTVQQLRALPNSDPPPSSTPTLALPGGLDELVDEDTHDLDGEALAQNVQETGPMPRPQPARRTSVLPQVTSGEPLPFENRPSRPPPPAAGDPSNRPGNTATGAMPMPGSADDSSADWPEWSPGPKAPPGDGSSPPPAPPHQGTAHPPPPPAGVSPWAGGSATAAKRPAPPKPNPPPRRSSAPPAAPPERLTPAVDSDANRGDPFAAPSTSAGEGPALDVAIPEPKAAPEPDAPDEDDEPRLSLEDYAGLRARLEARPDDEARWLEESEIDQETYEDADRRLGLYIESSALRGHIAPLEQFDAAYVSALGEVIEREMDLPTCAAIEVAAEQGRVEAALERFGIPESALGPLRRHITRQAIEDDAFRRGLRDEMMRLRHAS